MQNKALVAVVLVLAAFSLVANGQTLDENWTITVAGQSVPVHADGSFFIPNIPDLDADGCGEGRFFATGFNYSGAEWLYAMRSALQAGDRRACLSSLAEPVRSAGSALPAVLLSAAVWRCCLVVSPPPFRFAQGWGTRASWRWGEAMGKGGIVCKQAPQKRLPTPFDPLISTIRGRRRMSRRLPAWFL